MFYTEKMAIAAAIEVAYGTPATPSGATDAILAEGVKIIPLDGDEIERKHVRAGGFGGYMKTLINKRVGLSFGVRLRAAGAAGGTPPIDALLRAVGFAGITSAGVHRQYKLVSGNFESATFSTWRGDTTAGILHQFVGGRGSWKLAFAANAEPMLMLDFQALYIAPSAQVMPTNFSYSAFTNVKIPPLGKTNTTFTLGGYAAILDKLDIDSGLQVKHRPKINYEAIDITGRAVTGSIVVQEPTLAQKDYFATAYGAPEVMVFENGVTPGEIVRIDAARVQRGKPELGDMDGVSALTLPLSFLPSDAGDDNDLILTFK